MLERVQQSVAEPVLAQGESLGPERAKQLAGNDAFLVVPGFSGPEGVVGQTGGLLGVDRSSSFGRIPQPFPAFPRLGQGRVVTDKIRHSEPEMTLCMHAGSCWPFRRD